MSVSVHQSLQMFARLCQFLFLLVSVSWLVMCHPSLIIHFPTCSQVSERTSERMSAAERTSEASSAEQAVRANEQTEGRVTQYLRLDSWLFLDHSTVGQMIQE